jgi:methylthioribulose-1-phosphate dehydratase
MSPRTPVDTIIAAARWLDARGWMPATAGNCSLRIDPRTILITVSGAAKGALTRQDVMQIDDTCKPLDSDRAPSAEAALHASLYRLDPRIGAVVHTHSVPATVLGLPAAANSWNWTGYEILKAFPGVRTHEAHVEIPVFANRQDMTALVNEIEARWKGPPFPGYVLGGHGSYAWGVDMDEAIRAIEALEFLAACELERRRIHP